MKISSGVPLFCKNILYFIETVLTYKVFSNVNKFWGYKEIAIFYSNLNTLHVRNETTLVCRL